MPETGGLQSRCHVVLVYDLVAEPPQFILRIEGATHDPIIERRKLFLTDGAHTDSRPYWHNLPEKDGGREIENKCIFIH